MKRTCLISSALTLSMLAPALASAEPAIVYVPTETVTLTPLNTPPCGSGINSALGCGGVSMAAGVTDIDPYDGAAALITAMTDALEVYDVLVTDVRPPVYVPYLMLMPSDDPAEMSMSFTCTSAGINCSSRQRNDMLFTLGTTVNCMNPEITHAALYAFGRASGLEGVDNPDDYMNYVPDYTTPPMGFMDACADRVNQMGFNDQGNPIVQQLECTSLDHFECPDDADGDPGQNSHQDLLSYYGERTEDTEAPVFSNIVPEDGAVLAAGDPLTIDVDIADAETVLGVRWTISSPALMDLIGAESFSQCTNDSCDDNWNDATPLKATDSDWGITFQGLNPGEYTITLEAADFHGNVAEMVTYTVIIEGDATDTGNVDTGADETAGPVDTGNNDDSAFTSGQDSDDGNTDGATGANDDGGGGCSCRTSQTPGQTPGGAVLMLLGLVGLGAMRRRG